MRKGYAVKHIETGEIVETGYDILRDRFVQMDTGKVILTTPWPNAEYRELTKDERKAYQNEG